MKSSELLAYFFSGLTSAAIYAIAASGLVLTYTTTGVFNFAHGAMGMVAAFTYWEMRFGWHWPAPVALFVCLVVIAPMFGVFLQVAIMRRLEGTSETTKLVVTLSLLLALLGLALWIWDPNKPRPIQRFFEGSAVQILGVRVPYHQLAAFAIAVAVAVGLRLLLYRTRIGIAMRACVDDRSLAQLNGARPGATAMLAWAVGVSLAALSGILISPNLQLSALPLTLLIINAYAAAMIGRLRSLPMTFAGALILGMANDFGRGYLTRIHTGQQYLNGLLASLPVIILFIVLLVLPQARLRGHRLLRTREIAPMPTRTGAVAFAAAVVVGTAMLAPVLGNADLVSLQRVWGLGIVALSLIPLVGYAGQISLCQLSFAGIGMMVVGHLGAHGNPLALIAAAVITGLVGALIALPALRLSGIYLALSTAAFAVAMDRWIFPLPVFHVFGHRVDLFMSGSLLVSRTRWLGLGLEGPKAYFVYGSIVFAVMSLVVAWIRRSAYGQRLLALKDSPAACATLGMNPTFTRMSVFAVSAAMAGVGGAVYGGALRAVDAGSLDFFTGLAIVMVMVIAGVTTPGGALFAGTFLGAPILQNVFPSLRQLQTVLVGFAGIGLGKNPNGFIQNDIKPRWQVFLEERAALAAVVAGLALLWVLRIADVLDNWAYAVLTIVALALAPAFGAAARGRKIAIAGRGDPVVPKLSAPLEWLGVTTPYDPKDIAHIDEVLALPVLENR